MACWDLLRSILVLNRSGLLPQRPPRQSSLEHSRRGGFKSHVIGWFATHGETIPGGGVVSNIFSSPTAGPGQPWSPAPRVRDLAKSAHAAELNELRVSPEEIDAGFVSLFVPEWQKVDQEKDHRLGHLRSISLS